MKLRGGEVIEFQINNTSKRWRISKVDGNVVKIFDEEGSYMQMPYNDLERLINETKAKVEIVPIC